MVIPLLFATIEWVTPKLLRSKYYKLGRTQIKQSQTLHRTAHRQIDHNFDKPPFHQPRLSKINQSAKTN